MNMITRIKFVREAANVHRVHATPALTPYSVGMHSYNMLSMLRILYPDARPELIWAVHQHDSPERVTSDMSHPAKINGLLNMERQAQVEEYLNISVYGADYVQELTDFEVSWLKGLDMIEFYCWTKDQLMLGNRNVETQKTYVEGFMARNKHLYPKEILEAYHEIKMSDWAMLPDWIEEETI